MCSCVHEQDDLQFRLEYAHPYLDGIDNPRNRTGRVACFNTRKLSAVFTGGPTMPEVPAVWVDRAGIKASISEVQRIALYSTALKRKETLLSYNTSHCTVLHSAMEYSTAQCCTVLSWNVSNNLCTWQPH